MTCLTVSTWAGVTPTTISWGALTPIAEAWADIAICEVEAAPTIMLTDFSDADNSALLVALMEDI